MNISMQPSKPSNGVCKEFCVNGFCDQNSGSLSSNMMLN